MCAWPMLANESVMSNFSKLISFYFHILHENIFKMIYDLLESDKTIIEHTMNLKAIETAELILRNIEFKFSEDSKEKSPSNVIFSS